MSVSTCDQHVWLLVSQQFTQCRKGGMERGRCDRVPLFCMYKFHGVSSNYMHMCVHLWYLYYPLCSDCRTLMAARSAYFQHPPHCKWHEASLHAVQHLCHRKDGE